MDSNSILTMRNVSVKYVSHKEWVLQDINLDVSVGSRIAIVGKNGSGKSTLLKVICGLMPLQKGEVLFQGEMVASKLGHLAYMPQHCRINFQFPVTLKRFISMGRYVHRNKLQHETIEDNLITHKWMQYLGLENIGHKLMSELSGGQQQRAFLARVLVQDAKLILFDEPLNALDTETQDLFMKILNEMQSLQKAFIMVTHHADWEAIPIDKIYKLEEGKLHERFAHNADVNPKGCC